ncbi:peptidase domain-containing ABC transporter [Alteromonas sp. MTD1]|uniref:peptidase domain-containing ABC transporter n=1 Tax=Alteromonas sp. MTD1 TaxID=3057962 RepID=UPI0036F1BF11
MTTLTFTNPIKQLNKKARVPVVLQSEAAECGLACLNMIAQFYGDKRDLTALRQQLCVSLRGATLKDVMHIATSMGFQTRALKIEMDDLSSLTCPAILHWNMNHFVVLTRVKNKKVWINDPAVGLRQLSLAEASRSITGIALEVKPSDDFTPEKNSPRLRLASFFSKAIGFKRNLATLLALSVVLQIFALATPYYMQTVIDDVLTHNNDALLKALAIGFSFLLFIEVFTGIVRKLLVLSVSTRVQLQLSASVFKHLLSLPLDYFAKRHIGDIVSRFGSLAHIREFLTTGVVTAVLDGVMAIVTLVVMAMYSIKLSATVLVVMALYLAIRLYLLPVMKRLTTEKIALSANEQSHFMESVRAILPIRVYQQGAVRHSDWQNKLVASLNKDILLGKINIGSASANQVLFGVENLIVVYIGATLVMDNELTIGMLLAFIAYKTRFVGAIDGIIGKLIELKMLNVHFARLSDILFTAPATSQTTVDQNQRLCLSTNQRSLNAMTAEHIGYRYSENSEWVFRNLNIAVKAGEIIAIVGDSGSGKSTLLKCLMGLYPLNEGRLKHFHTAECKKPENVLSQQDLSAPYSSEASSSEGCSSEACPPQYHSIGERAPIKVASVLQEDTCLSGTIADNISCFEDNPSIEKIVRSAQLACLHDEIAAMPMQYFTLIGDMGSSLSGGQKQRLLLARALYQNPDILFLDEASSHLDIENEAKINAHLKSLNITRIIVAHRPQSIAIADRVLCLRNGQLHSYSPSEVPGNQMQDLPGENQ